MEKTEINLLPSETRGREKLSRRVRDPEQAPPLLEHRLDPLQLVGDDLKGVPFDFNVKLLDAHRPRPMVLPCPMVRESEEGEELVTEGADEGAVHAGASDGVFAERLDPPGRPLCLGHGRAEDDDL